MKCDFCDGDFPKECLQYHCDYGVNYLICHSCEVWAPTFDDDQEEDAGRVQEAEG